MSTFRKTPVEQPAPEGSLYAYSFNEEEYTGPFDSIEAALAEVAMDPEFSGLSDGNDDVIVYVGEVVTPLDVLKGREQWIGEYLSERLDEFAADDIPSEDPIFPLTDEQAKALGAHVLEWFEKNAAPTRFGIKASTVKQHFVSVGDE